MEGFVLENIPEVKTEGAISNTLHKRSRNAVKEITLEYEDGTRTTHPLKIVMKQNYQTLRSLYLLMDRKYYFNREVGRKIMDEISKIGRKAT